MTKQIDLTGRRFGTLLVLRRDLADKPRIHWICQCDCGMEISAQSNNLMSTNTKSCGCDKPRRIADARTTHGNSKSRILRQEASIEYACWGGLIGRCENPKNPAYRNYGGRGITVCDRWRESFENFLADMGRRPAPHLSLDRFPDPYGNYEPTNCRWASASEQGLNRRPLNPILINGERIGLAEACRRLGLSYSSIKHRIARGTLTYDAIKLQLGA